MLRRNLIAMFAAAYFVCMGGSAFAAASAASSSLDAQTAAQNEVSAPVDSTSYWSTEGSGYCATGNLTCSSGRQIGCSATGADYVKCQYTAGDVGWVRCDAVGGGTSSAFSDQCP